MTQIRNAEALVHRLKDQLQPSDFNKDSTLFHMGVEQKKREILRFINAWEQRTNATTGDLG